MSGLDQVLAEFRALAKHEGAERVEVTVRQDGRVTIELVNRNGFSMVSVVADLERGSAIMYPNAAMHSAFASWGGK